MRSPDRIVSVFKKAVLQAGNRKLGIKALVKDAGYPPKMASLIYKRLFEGLNTKELDLIKRRTKKGRCAFLVPANVPDPILLSFVKAVYSGGNSVIRLSAHWKYFSAWFKKMALRSGAEVRFISSKKAFLKEASLCDACTVYGSDMTIRELEASLKGACSLIAHASRYSLSVYDLRKVDQNKIRKLAQQTARDIWMYDQKGCLSPQEVKVIGDARYFAESLQEELLSINKEGGSFNRSAEDKRIRYHTLLQLQSKTLKSGLRFISKPHHDLPAVLLSNRSIEEHLQAQIIPVRSYKEERLLIRDLKKIRFLQACALWGSAAFKQKIKSVLAASGVSRYVVPGTLQSPALSWEGKVIVLK